MDSCCSSDDEVFFGPITKKEIMKHLTMRRPTPVLKKTLEDDPQGDISSDKEDTWQNLTLPAKLPSCREHPTWVQQSRSFNVLLDCDVSDGSRGAETPAPPPSPELSGYNGSPYPALRCTRQQLCTSLKGIAEEEGCADGMDMQSTPVQFSFFRYSDPEWSGHWRNLHTHSDYSEGSNESLSLVSNLDNSLVEDTSKLSLAPMITSEESVETCAISSEVQQMSDEDRKIRGLLIEKVEQHEAQTQQLRNFKKQADGVSGVCKQSLLSDTTNDGLITLNDVQEVFSLGDDIPANDNEESLNKDASEIISSGFKSGGKDFQPQVSDTLSGMSGSCHFSGAIGDKHFASPVVRPVRYHGDVLSHNLSVGDLDCYYGRKRIDQVIDSLPSQASKDCTSPNYKLDGVSITAPARPPSPEFDIEVPEEKALLPNNISYSYFASEYSMISEAEDSLEASRGENIIEAPGGNCASVGNAMVSADEDGGFLSVLSAAALYHASLKDGNGDHFDRSGNMRLTENNYTYSQNAQEKLQCTSAPSAVLFVHNECDSVKKKVTFHQVPEEDCGEFREKDRKYEESPGRDLRNAYTDEGGHSLSGIQGDFVLDGSTHSNEQLCCQEMDARSDLSDNDKRNIEDMKTQVLSSDEGFNDTLEEMEMMFKYGMDYMLSSNDKECPDMTEKQPVCHSISTPNKSVHEMPGFKCFGDAINEGENHHHITDGIETCNENHIGGCARPETYTSAMSHNNPEPSSCTVVCDYVKNASTGGAHDNVFVKSQCVHFEKFHKKLQAVVSPTMNLKVCQTPRNDKASPFKIPVKAAPHATSIPKLTPARTNNKSSLKPATVVTPIKRPLNYKKIVSPVGAYIHNIPSPSLFITVKPNRGTVVRNTVVTPRHDDISEIDKSPHILEQKGRENVDTNNIQHLPFVSYKSVPSIKLEQSQQEKMPRLNERMRKLVNTPKPHVIRHEGRVKVTGPGTPHVKVSSAKKLITGSDSGCVASSDADAEVSIVVRKETGRTHTLGV